MARAYARELETAKQRPDSWKLWFEEDAKVKDLFSKKTQIERENEMCIGGLRNPWHSTQELPKWRKVGSVVWRLLQASSGQLGELNNPVAWVGSDHEGQPDQEMSWLRKKVSSVFGCEAYEHGLWGSLLEKQCS